MYKFSLIKNLSMLGLVSWLALVPVLSAQAIEYGGFGGRPAYPVAENTRTESIFVHTLEPGSSQNEGVLVVNNSAEKKTLLVYAADSTPSSGGAFACKQLVEPKTDVGAWITLTKSEVTLEPATKEIVPFVIRVPKNAGVGEHNGCILIQEKKAGVTGQTGAVVSVRTGLRVAITVPGSITRKLQIVGFTKEATADGLVLHPLVKNIGNVSIDAEAKVTTRYFFGLTHFVHGGQYPILRGDTSEWNFELKRPFWGGWYRSNFTVTYDENTDAGVGVSSGKPLTELASPAIWFFSFPTTLALVIEIGALVLLLLVIWLLWFRKNNKTGLVK